MVHRLHWIVRSSDGGDKLYPNEELNRWESIINDKSAALDLALDNVRNTLHALGRSVVVHFMEKKQLRKDVLRYVNKYLSPIAFTGISTANRCLQPTVTGIGKALAKTSMIGAIVASSHLASVTLDAYRDVEQLGTYFLALSRIWALKCHALFSSRIDRACCFQDEFGIPVCRDQ